MPLRAAVSVPQVAPGVWRITTPLASRPREVHAYLLRGEGGEWVLVDGGVASEPAWAVLRDGIAGVIGAMERLDVHVVTHMHLDHVGLVPRVRQASGARLVMGRLDAERAAHAHADPADEAEYRAALLRDNGAPDGFRQVAEAAGSGGAAVSEFVPTDDALDGDGGELPGVNGWRWVWTPGHTAGHLSLFRPADGVLVAGDAVLPRITPTIGVNRQRPDPVGDYLHALDRLAALAPALLLPGHGEPILEPLPRIGALREATLDESRLALQCLDGEPRSAWAVAMRRHPASDLPAAVRMLALREARAHLDHLVATGRAERHRSEGGVWVFTPALGHDR